ncbi:MAG: hypothetical protein ACKN81_02070 [Pirellulaceae bacterium]
MSRTLILVERPFRDLRSQAMLAALLPRLGGDVRPLLATVDKEVPSDFEAVPLDLDPASLGVTRMVLAGIFEDRAEFQRMIAIASRGVAAGATLEARSLSLAIREARHDPPEGIALLDLAQLLEVREHQTMDILIRWRVAAPLRLLPYPERTGDLDMMLAQKLPAGPILGLSMIGGPDSKQKVEAKVDLLRKALAPFAGWPILPLPVEDSGSIHDDGWATLDFAGMVLPQSPILLPEMADAEWRRSNLTPARLRGLVARCHWLVARHELPASMAIALGLPVIGIALGRPPERRIASCLYTLANDLPNGSRLLWLGMQKGEQG